MGFSCQCPAGRASQRDEEAIRQWHLKRWPMLKKCPPGGKKHLLHHRERLERAAYPNQDMGAGEMHSGIAVQLQLKAAHRDCSAPGSRHLYFHFVYGPIGRFDLVDFLRA